MDQLQYPIGKYIEQPFSQQQLRERLLDIQTLPMHVEHAILNMDEAELQTPYRPAGWTKAQVVHHIADSHMNAYIRFKGGLTEDNPTIKPYDEKAWAEMADTKNLPINISITLLFSLHLRLHEILKNVKEEEWNRTVFHPEHQKQMTLWYLLGMYAWHGRHHVAHIKIPLTP
ncbi:MAG TPA: putative metal-dependent hydrolase [Ferruginibacter sp.]|nr:putative metal-dependent hydrolase [Ferruginibacter sp.]